MGQRVGDISKGNCTSHIVDGACHAIFCVARHGGDGIVWLRFSLHVCRLEFEVELTGGQGHRFVVSIFVDFRGLNIERLGVILKGVGKRGNLRIFGCAITEYMLNNRGSHLQLAAAVVRDGNRHTVERAVIRNTCNLILVIGGDILGDVVHILAGFRKGDTSEVKFDRRSFGDAAFSILHIFRYICTRHTFSQRGTIDSHQTEPKFIAVLPIAAHQNLFALERVIFGILAHGNRVGVIGVCHRDFFGCTCRDRAFAVIGNARCLIAGGQTFFRDGIGAARGQAHNLGSLAVFQGESTAVLDGIFVLFNACLIGNGILVRGIGVQGFALFARQLKLHRKVGVCVRVQAFVGFNHLGNLHATCGVHGQLTVVAKVQHTLVCVKIPLEVNAALRGAGCVVFLIAQLAINGGGQAAFFGALFDIAFAVCLTNAFSNLIRIINVHGYHIGLGKRFIMVVRVLIQVVQLIVIGCARFKSGDRLTIFGKQRGVLGMIVEAIACCRGKGGSGRADGFFAICRFFGGIKFVGVEADLAAFCICCNIAGKCVIGYIAGRDLAARIALKTNRVDDADGLGVVDFQLLGAIGVCGLIIPQGQHTGRDLDLHMVAVTAAAMGDGDNDVFQIGCLGVGTADRVVMLARKGIGIHIAGAFYARLRKDLVGKGNGLKALDFHIVAQGIIESHVAVCFGFVRNMRGACQCDRYGIEDVLKDLLQRISAGSRHIVICIVRSVAEVPVPGSFGFRVSGKGVVAGDRLHILVCF